MAKDTDAAVRKHKSKPKKYPTDVASRVERIEKSLAELHTKIELLTRAIDQIDPPDSYV